MAKSEVHTVSRGGGRRWCGWTSKCTSIGTTRINATQMTRSAKNHILEAFGFNSDAATIHITLVFHRGILSKIHPTGTTLQLDYRR